MLGFYNNPSYDYKFYVKGLLLMNSNIVLRVLSELIQARDHKNPVHSNENRRQLSEHDVTEHDVTPSDKSV